MTNYNRTNRTNRTNYYFNVFTQSNSSRPENVVVIWRMASPSGEFPVAFLHQCESTIPMIDEKYQDEQSCLIDMFLNYNTPQPMDQVYINELIN